VRLLDSGRIVGLLAHDVAGCSRWQVNQWKRIHRLLDPDDPDALPPENPKRKHRRNRVARFEDLPTRDHAPATVA
jgi:hypothetical protein